MSSEARLAARFAVLHPEPAARTLQGLPPGDVALFLDSLPPEPRGTVLRTLAPENAAACVLAFPPDRWAELIDGMSQSAAVALIRAAPEPDRRALILALPARRRRQVERTLSFAAETAGRLAELDVPTAAGDQSAADALKRSHKRGPDLPYLYVTDRDQRLVGVVSRRQLRKATAETKVADIMLRAVRYIPAFSPSPELMDHPAWRDHDALPVVDGAGVLVGFLRHKVLRRAVERRSSPDVRSAGEGGLVAAGSAYCEILARALVAFTTTPTQVEAPSATGGAE